VSEPGHTRPLAALRRDDSPAFGGKSAALGELIAAEIPVAPGFALSTGAFRAFVREAGLDGKIAAELSRVAPGDVDSVVRASHAISEAMRFAPVPAPVRDEIARAYAELADEAGVREPPVAVRSSALAVGMCLSSTPRQANASSSNPPRASSGASPPAGELGTPLVGPSIIHSRRSSWLAIR